MLRLKSLAWGLALLLTAFVALRAFVGDLFTVGSSSMVPTLLPGQRVVVLFDTSLPERGEVVVVRAAEADPLVKRVLGLPGEELSITSAGDLMVDRERLDRSATRLPLVPVFDLARWGWSPLWTTALPEADAGGWVLPEDLTLETAVELTDGHLDPSGAWIPGEEIVGDLELAVEGLKLEGGATLGLTLREGTEHARLEVSAEGLVLLRLARLPGSGEAGPVLRTELGRLEQPCAPGARVSLANLDDVLLVRVDGVLALQAEFGAASPGGSGPRATLDCRGGDARLSGLLLARDLHYTRRGSFAVDSPVRLGPGEVFLLGDASRRSADSREFGPVPLSELVGRVLGPLGSPRP
ncbi:MAG: signal peptidase I [Planctomycetota bacterium]|nr:signal peptidase I [Planctomycetota bacterium]